MFERIDFIGESRMAKPVIRRRLRKPRTFADYKAEAAKRLMNAKPGTMFLIGGHRFIRLERKGKENDVIGVRLD